MSEDVAAITPRRRPASPSVDEGPLSQAHTLIPNPSGTADELLAGYVRCEQSQGRRRAEDDELGRVISALNAFHGRYGFLSDEFSDL